MHIFLFFINFVIKATFYQNQIKSIIKYGSSFGKDRIGKGKSANVKNIVGNFLELDNKLDIGIGTNLMIVNPDADPEAYVEDVFKVDKLNSLNGAYAEFSLTSWLQYFKFVVPKRKFYKNENPRD